MEWFNRMNDALDMIERRLEDRFDIEEIAKAAYSSPFHFQRMFFVLTGMTVAEYARKRKLTLAAQELAAGSAKVLDVALKYGYDSPESFAKAFRKLHGLAPSEARQPGAGLKAFPRISFHLSLKGDQNMDYRIEEKAGFDIVGKCLHTTCENEQQLKDIPLFWQSCGTDGTMDKLLFASKGDAMYGACLNDAPGEYAITYMIARESDGSDVPEGFEKRTIPDATWAVFTAAGALPHSVQNTFKRIFQEWFPATGYEHSGGPELEVYPPGDAYGAEYSCEIWIPIIKK